MTGFDHNAISLERLAEVINDLEYNGDLDIQRLNQLLTPRLSLVRSSGLLNGQTGILQSQQPIPTPPTATYSTHAGSSLDLSPAHVGTSKQIAFPRNPTKKRKSWQSQNQESVDEDERPEDGEEDPDGEEHNEQQEERGDKRSVEEDEEEGIEGLEGEDGEEGQKHSKEENNMKRTAAEDSSPRATKLPRKLLPRNASTHISSAPEEGARETQSISSKARIILDSSEKKIMIVRDTFISK
ncbi:MAG: hypothetical protein Q9170_007457 [Blastenia crenularia]